MADAVKANGSTTDRIKILEKIPPVANPQAKDPAAIASNINYHAHYSPHFSPYKFEPEQAFYATAESVRDQLIKQWNDTYSHYHKVNPKQTYYLSMEYLQGRALTNAVGNLDVQDAYANALKQLGYALEEITEQEKDAALGNGGLGRLASCFLDSMATLSLPAWGYGLRYRYGLFKQLMTKTGQEEIAEDWLEKFSPWEIPRHDVVFPIRFFGQVEINPNGSRKWIGGEVIQAAAYDVPIPGYKTKDTNSLRLWEAKARAEDFNLFEFNDGKYESAALLHSRICAVLYPGDATEDGKLLRLKQQYFLCSASLQDIITRFKERLGGRDKILWSEFPSKVAVQLNDTHPTLSIPELMRLLMDDEGLGWDEAWDITNRTIAYTNHTVLPEALEKWSQTVMWKLLPRHMEIIEEIDKRVRYTLNLVNGVAQLHSDILKAELFSDYVKFADNSELPAEWESAKLASKQQLANYVLQVTGVSIDPNSLFDIQIKRIHEYKRQLMNIMGAVYRYKKLKEMSPEERKKTTPRTIMIGGKAFATYTNAKRIVKLVSDVGAVVNTDPEVNSFLKIIFVPNYNVSVAEVLIPGSELSQHISTAGMEASGTSNMKFALNGCLIIGTLDELMLKSEKKLVKKISLFLVQQLTKFLGCVKKESKDWDRKKWTKMSILSTAGSGKFSSDRTIGQYANEIWKIDECPLP
ncbi:hypothetical protein SASPL_135816 [Salvia splendens]|uniref:Alpha-1,4 glucan phosphorylase n=1 Tax=Salvia splendens TaxID=180675 RepID=A0A8X8WX52_SALSN|nr:hypothetical protein SASPL_135816 [Salvia splendens]